MKFTPKSREEAMQSGLLPKGNYQFTVKQAFSKVSKKSGNPMIELILSIWDSSGREHQIYDYLMESVEHKLRHFCYSIGCGDMSETGEFDIFKVMNRTGTCKIRVKEDNEGYLPKNEVVDYLMENIDAASLDISNGFKAAAEIDQEFSDTVPF